MIQIRTATKEDLPQLMRLMHQYIVDFYKSPEPTQEALQGLVTHLLENPYEGVQFVAESENLQLAGFATLYFTFNTLEVKRMAVLYDLFVSSDFRRQNVGESLFQTCLDHVREHDYSHMFWETDHDNIPAQTLYDKMGATRARWLNYEIK